MLKANDTCPVCDKGKLVAQVIVEKFEYKGKTTLIEDYYIFKCEVCEEEFVSQESIKKSEKILTDFRRGVDGLLLSSEIKAIRMKLHMTQVGLAERLGVGKKNFARYENGLATQSRTMDNLLRLIDKVPNALQIISGTASQQLSFTMLEESSIEYDTSYECENDEVIEHNFMMEEIRVA
jgi:HTH-type transcriptional regulator/antitoxin MqsA